MIVVDRGGRHAAMSSRDRRYAARGIRPDSRSGHWCHWYCGCCRPRQPGGGPAPWLLGRPVGVVGVGALTLLIGWAQIVLLPQGRAERARWDGDDLAVPTFWGWRRVRMTALTKIGAASSHGRSATSYFCFLRDADGRRIVVHPTRPWRVWPLVQAFAAKANESRPQALSTRARIYLSLPPQPPRRTRLRLRLTTVTMALTGAAAMLSAVLTYALYLGL